MLVSLCQGNRNTVKPTFKVPLGISFFKHETARRYEMEGILEVTSNQ